MTCRRHPGTFPAAVWAALAVLGAQAIDRDYGHLRLLDDPTGTEGPDEG